MNLRHCIAYTCVSAILGSANVLAQVLTADDLARSGVTRLSDILELADDWVGSSTEGFHWDLAPLGTSWEASPDWHLFLDGHPIGIQTLNRQSLNLLPVTISEICEVHLHATPNVIHGIVTHAGAIHIRRCTPTEGLTIAGQFSAGNETGDPGPYKYTNVGGTNVDRTGPTIHGSISAASKDRFIRVTGASDEHHATDPRIRPRVLQLYQGEKDARIIYRGLGVDAGLSGHRVGAGISQVEDLMFLPIMGRELPLDQKVSYVFASFTPLKGLGYSLVGSSAGFTTRQNPESLSVDIAHRQVLARVFSSTRLSSYTELGYGVTAALAEARFHPTHVRNIVESIRIDATLHPDLPSPLQMGVMSSLSLDAGVPGYEFFSHTWHDAWGLELRLLARQRGLASRMNFANWAGRGKLPQSAVFRYEYPGLPRRESIRSIDVTWSAAGRQIRLYLSGGVRTYANVVYPVTEGTLDSTQTHLQTINSFVSTEGSVARTSLRIDFSVLRYLAVKLHGSYTYPWSDSQIFLDAWNHRIQVGIRGEFQPNKRFSIDMRLRYVGPSSWNEYQEAAKENPVFYVMRLPSAVHLHLTVQKRLWEEHLRISATMRNVLDHPHIAHPAGARSRALFQVALSYSFGRQNATL